MYLDNDVRTVLLAENLFGSVIDYKDTVCIYIGSGVGGAVMVNGENELMWLPLKKSFRLIQPKIGGNSGVIGASSLVLSEFLRHTNNDI